MTRNVVVSGAFALALSAASAAHAATDADLAEIRDQIRQLKESYEARIQRARATAEGRRDQERRRANGAADPGPAPTPAVASSPAPHRGISCVQSRDLGGAAGHLRQPVAGSGRVRDPRLRYGEETSRPAEARLRPRRIGAHAFRNVDDKISGNLTVSLTPENTVEVEEAYGVLTALPYGFAPKFGRFFSGIGYLNEQHQHVWDFQDAPLPYQAFLGGQFAQRRPAAQVGGADRHVPRARRGDRQRRRLSRQPTRNSNGIGSWRAFVHAGGDIGASHSWRAGLSYLQTARRTIASTLPATSRATSAQLAFAGKSQLAIADFVWKYAPNGNATRHQLQAAGRVFLARARTAT